MTSRGAVTASSRSAAEAGGSVLAGGGNAVDAAVAAALVSCVADGCNTGIGGYGGHMVIAPPQGAPACIDFNMWLPEGERSTYRGRRLERGPQSSAIPNVVAGLARALSQFGTLGWAEASAPALACAAEGVESNSTTAQAFAEVEGAPFVAECFSFEETGHAPPAHFRFRQPALAQTIDTMASKGPSWFYEGPIGEAACRILRQAGHQVDRHIWAQAPHAVRLETPAAMRLEEASIHSAPLCTSGSACMFGTMAAGVALLGEHQLDSPAMVAAWAKRLAAMWTYRFTTLDGNSIEQDGLEDWIERALSFSDSRPVPEAAGHTCHLNAVDSDGMIVAMTLTHGPSWFGGRWAVPGTGVIMNSGLDLLKDVDPCLRDGRAYAVTNMCPTVVQLAGGSLLAAGCPGARRIPSIVGMFLARHLIGGLGLADAIAGGRFHSESHERVTLERGRWSSDVESSLGAVFPQVAEEGPTDYYGPFTTIRRDGIGSIEIGLDDRAWRGYAAESGHVTGDGVARR
jgi:gamma-glutamyltranspeptidase / glutathione hydrolase